MSEQQALILAEGIANYAIHKKDCPARRWNSVNRVFGVCTCGLKRLIVGIQALRIENAQPILTESRGGTSATTEP